MKKWGGVLFSLSGILACNFFQASILPGVIFIVLWCWLSINEHKLLWKKGIPFCFMFLSGMTAVIAPGNYVRHAHFSSSYNIVKGFADAMKMAVIILNHLFHQPLVILLIAFCIYMGIRFRAGIARGKTLMLTLFISLLTLVINCFPITFGYARIGSSARLYFLLDFTALVGIVTVSVLAGMHVACLGYIFSKYQMKLFMTAFTFLLLYSTIFYNQDMNTLPWFQTVIATRNIKEIHDVWKECLIEIRDSKESEVEIVIEEEFFDSPILKLPELSDDAEWWVNAVIAQYYNKDKVIVSKK